MLLTPLIRRQLVIFGVLSTGALTLTSLRYADLPAEAGIGVHEVGVDGGPPLTSGLPFAAVSSSTVCKRSPGPVWRNAATRSESSPRSSATTVRASTQYRQPRTTDVRSTTVSFAWGSTEPGPSAAPRNVVTKK